MKCGHVNYIIGIHYHLQSISPQTQILQNFPHGNIGKPKQVQGYFNVFDVSCLFVEAAASVSFYYGTNLVPTLFISCKSRQGVGR